MNSLKRTVLDLLIGIIGWGSLFEIIGVLVVKNKLAYSVGMLCGVLIAAGLAFHMAYSLNNAFDWDAEVAVKEVKKGVMFRYVAVLIVTSLRAYFKIGNILACFLGIMTLKTAAYIQPYVHRFINHIFNIEEGGCENAITIDDDEFDFGQWAESGFYDSRFDKF